MSSTVSRLAIGTAQFGMDYGVANAVGKMPIEAARAVLDLARDSGIDTVDTAIAYGASQRTLGEIGVQGLRVVTKLPAFVESDAADISGWVRRAVSGALGELGLPSIYGLMFHNANDLAGPHGPAIYRELQQLREAGVVRKVGVSIYDPEELGHFGGYDLDLVQAPYNALDRRISDSRWLDRLVERGVEIHTRSVFLQGLILMSDQDRPPYFDTWADQLHDWDKWCDAHSVSRLEAALGFVLADDRVDRVLVGVDGPRQLIEIVAASHHSEEVPQFDGAAVADLALVNPSLWKV